MADRIKKAYEVWYRADPESPVTAGIYHTQEEAKKLYDRIYNMLKDVLHLSRCTDVGIQEVEIKEKYHESDLRECDASEISHHVDFEKKYLGGE